MNSRERTFLALEHQAGDRIPIDFWASKGMIRNLEKAFGCTYAAFLDEHDVDLRYIAGPKYTGPPLPEGHDIWGVKRVSMDVGEGDRRETYSEVAVSPLGSAASAEEVLDYPGWPSADWFDYSVVEGQCDEVRAQGRVAVFMGDRLNRVAQLKPAMYLRGGEAIFMDLAMNEDLARAIFGKIRAFYCAYIERIMEASKGKIDIVLTGDDFGGQNGLLVSADMWRAFLQPGFAEYVAQIKGHGAKVMHHTCGSVHDIIPDLIDCGLDVLQSLQPDATGMALGGLKAKYGERLCFQGGISIQQTMPFGSEKDIRTAVKTISDLFREDGGYIFGTAHNIQADTPVASVKCLLQAYHEHGAC